MKRKSTFQAIIGSFFQNQVRLSTGGKSGADSGTIFVNAKNAKLFLPVLSLTIFLAGCGARENSSVAANPPDEPPTAAAMVSAPGQDAAEPAIAAAPDGSVYVVWVEHLPQKHADVYIRRFDAEQKPLGDAVRVNPQPGGATAWRGDQPTVKIGADAATVYIGWTARVETAEGAANDLYLSVSRDRGATFDAPVKVNDDRVAADRGMHSLEIDKAGRIFFAWLDERYLKTEKPAQATPENGSGETKHSHAEPNREVYVAVSTDDGKTFAANKKIAANACPCCKTSLASAPDGRLYIAWRQVLDGEFRHIAVSSSADGGNSFAPPAIVSDDRWQISACPVSGAGLAVDSKNTLRVVWFTAGQAGTPGLYAAQSSDGGKTFSARRLVSENIADGTPVLIHDSGDNARLLISAAKTAYTLTAAPNSAADFNPQSRIIDADFPSAAISKDQTFIAFIRKNGEKRNVMLLAQK